MWVAGVDGCRAGWFRACRNLGTGELQFDLVSHVEELADRWPHPAVIALDIPIGLPERGSRECDLAARRRLGPRRSSVFPAPIRAAIDAASREEASSITERIDGRKVGAQAFGIFAKIREVDTALQRRLRGRVREVHPEVSFAEWSGAPLRFAKRRREGKAERLALAEAWIGPQLLQRGRGDASRQQLADDDMLDAIAGLWTAHRIAAGTARTLPDEPPRDATGLPMEMVY